jgi:predicted Zn-dependent protease
LKMIRIAHLMFCFFSLPISVFAQDISKDTALGRDVYAFVEDNMGFYRQPEMEAYVSALGNKLVSHLADPLFRFSFHIVDSPEPNAFAAPGGRVFMTRGLLALPIAEDELACVLAHEIIHTQNRHYINRKRSLILGSIIALPGLVIEGIFKGPVGRAIASPFTGAGALINAQYSQGDEMEADKQGIGLAAVTGYNPGSLATILKRLEQEKELRTGDEEKKSYLGSHPYTPKRVRQIREEAGKQQINNIPSILSPTAFLQQFDGLPLGTNPAHGYTRDRKIYCPQFPLRLDSLEGWTPAFTPMSVALVSEKNDALLILEKVQDTISSAVYLSRFESEIRRISLKLPDSRHDIRWETYSGGMIEYRIDNGHDAMYIQIFAIDYRGKILNMVVAGAHEKKDALDRVLATVKPLEISDLPEAEVLVLKTSPARAGESVSAFARRMGAPAENRMISLLNDRSPEEILQEGAILKWIQRIPFVFKPENQ